MYAAPGAIQPGGGASYFISGIGGNNGVAEPFTPDGETVFLNAIGVLSGELVPEPSWLALLALGSLLIVRRRRD
jgi:hypothetical protein